MTGPRDSETESYRIEQGKPRSSDLEESIEDQMPAALNRGGHTDPPRADKPETAAADERGQEESMDRGVLP